MADRFNVAGAIAYYRRLELAHAITGNTAMQWRAQRLVEILEGLDG